MLRPSLHCAVEGAVEKIRRVVARLQPGAALESRLPQVAFLGTCAAVALLAVVFIGRAPQLPGDSPSQSTDRQRSDAIDQRNRAIFAADGANAFEPTPQQQEEYRTRVVPFVKKFCIECHSGADPEAGLLLTKYKDMAGVLKDRRVWRNISEKIRSGEMPPADTDVQPSPGEVSKVADWLTAELDKAVCLGPKDPGRVTVRRLNRAEYNNTIRDLVGVDFKPAEDFPSDDVGYGFDNIGDVLSMPPILLEKYLAAAEKIMDVAIKVDDPATAKTERIVGKKLSGAGNPGGDEDEGRTLASNGEAVGEFKFPRDAEYVLQAHAYGDQAGPEPCEMVFKLDGKIVKSFEVPNSKDNRVTYKIKLKVTAGTKPFAVAFTNDYYKDKKESPKEAGDRNLYVDWVEVVGPLGHDAGTLPDSHKRIMICTPPPDRPIVVRPRPANLTDKEARRKARDLARKEAEVQNQAQARSRADCAKKIVENFAKRAFRRPVRDEEVVRLMKLWQMADREGQPFERSVQVALTAVLVSPHFLFRLEVDPTPDDPHARYQINEHQLASRLSYFLWSTMPDDELIQLADRGELRKDGNLEKQVRRMARDRRTQAFVDNFGGQWLQTRRLSEITPDPKLFPNFDAGLRTAMQRETELFFATIVVEDRSILEFLDADYTFLNQRLAKHYGIEGIEGDHFRRVQLTGGQPGVSRRGGILTQAGVLTITSNPTRTSPVKRGKWVLDNILGTPPPPPPPDVPELNEADQVQLKGSLKQRMEQHRTNAACASCHRSMDPIGFSLENFDAVGAWRDTDGKHAIDASGELPGGRKFNGPKELKAVLKGKRDLFVRCLTERMLTYALGRGLEDYDDCTVEQISKNMARNNYKFSSLILEIVNSDPFQHKRGAGSR